MDPWRSAFLWDVLPSIYSLFIQARVKGDTRITQWEEEDLCSKKDTKDPLSKEMCPKARLKKAAKSS
ncbi:hypothetical protein KDAU_44460 [Dictyobacter aurantiacus]|uniref:Uncharacterized protein n=1 Tax=Dictyobacter aurantiacus TaxID=1936993 RepID=A0A401ZJS7_9CHLR|nr:hypothetical protein KDAU_44460 [Dictyobacter aurantiacus]